MAVVGRKSSGKFSKVPPPDYFLKASNTYPKLNNSVNYFSDTWEGRGEALAIHRPDSPQIELFCLEYFTKL